MRIEINGEHREFAQSKITLKEVIDQLSIAPKRIAVEVNKQIIRHDEWAQVAINDGDRIEIVHFVGGGRTIEGRRQ